MQIVQISVLVASAAAKMFHSPVVTVLIPVVTVGLLLYDVHCAKKEANAAFVARNQAANRERLLKHKLRRRTRQLRRQQEMQAEGGRHYHIHVKLPGESTEQATVNGDSVRVESGEVIDYVQDHVVDRELGDASAEEKRAGAHVEKHSVVKSRSPAGPLPDDCDMMFYI